jgi:hypothetical protein
MTDDAQVDELASEVVAEATGESLQSGARPATITKSFDDDQRFAYLVSLGRLRSTWRAVRKEARDHDVRDPLDCLDWAVTIEASLPQIQATLLSGDYVPAPPARYVLAKSKGSFRLMTVPNIRDALVYRLICDEALNLASPAKVKGAFFSRRHQKVPIGRMFNVDEDDPYCRFFDIWLRYHQYRTLTMLNSPYEVLVVTDITNYFDSISHELLKEYLAPFGLPRKAIGLLGRILEVFKPPAGHSPNPRIGIPVDEYDCSRELAHLFLFEHDRRIVAKVGEENFARWMDDQNVGARSKTEARRLVHLFTSSLASQRLTLNAGKTQFLGPKEVRSIFQLDTNAALDAWQEKYHGKLPRLAGEAAAHLERQWKEILNSPASGKGHWDKVLKRVYGLAAKVGSSLLDDRMADDLVEFPHLDQRIFTSLARRNKGQELFDLFTRYCHAGESLFEATEAAFFEACLLLDAPSALELQLRDLSRKFARGEVKGQSGGAHAKASALLCLYWFGGGAEELANQFGSVSACDLPSGVARAWIATIAAKDPRFLPRIRGQLLGHPADDVARLSRFLEQVKEGDVDRVGAYKHQKSRWPSPEFYDCRAWLQLEILSRAGSDQLRRNAKADLQSFVKLAKTRQELRVCQRVARRLSHTA